MSTELFDQFVKYGTESLTDKQLVSEVLSPSIAKELETAYGINFREIARKDWKQIRYDTGLESEEAGKVEMFFGLSRRVQQAEIGSKIQIIDPADAVAYLGPKLRDLNKEQFIVVFLNNAKVITGFHKISSGGSTATIVDPAEVMRQAVVSQANSILLAHNHPSGNPKESRADIKLTERIVKSGKLLGIPVNDHIIIAGDSYTSMRAKGLIS
ncbi:DNA repair protein RadC [Fodinibius roseus]|uniref:DNA repair protein RadC n=1 Tax=Fodinibius roseus TaxID=1194090 RepID=A0A1M5KM24_9BACT|nr:JAB domain-containing protein [Fodinibius roseus]SHG53760.1 DNA repair protein RadC [Fodinibius roseus]